MFVSVSLVVLFGCGDNAKTSASASASARLSCKDAPSSDYDPRCREGERDCCALLVEGKSPNDPALVELFGLACAGGHVPACAVAREAERPPQWKLDVFTKACGKGMSNVACRAEIFLGFTLEPDKMQERFADWCAHTNNAELPIGAGKALQCPNADPAVLALLKPDAVGCAQGAIERCQALAGMDGNSAALLRAVAEGAWKTAGLDPAQISDVLDNRVPAPETGDAAPKGTVTIAVSPSKAAGAKPVDGKALTDALGSRMDTLKKCIAADLTKPGLNSVKVTFDVIVDGRGIVAATPSSTCDAKNAISLFVCVRGAVQDAKVAGVTASGRAHVDLTLSK